MSILDRILATKREEVAAARAAISRSALERAAAAAPPARELAAALRRPAGEPIRALAEIKRASPSAGTIRQGADPASIAFQYQRGGAAAISVLTDRTYFDGALEFLGQVRAAVDLPLLRKDFIVDAFQIVEARAAGADAVLLIAAALDDEALAALMAETARFGMSALVEVHDAGEAARAVAAGATLIGVNHRNLATFEIDMTLTSQLAPKLGDAVLVAESGIKVSGDVTRLAAAGAHAILVGESLMRAPDPGAALRDLLAGAR